MHLVGESAEGNQCQPSLDRSDFTPSVNLHSVWTKIGPIYWPDTERTMTNLDMPEIVCAIHLETLA